MTTWGRPCLDCGTITNNLTRCTPCRLQQQRTRERNRTKRDRTKYHGNYATRAKHIRETATTCWVCGGGPDPTNPFQADHLDPDDPASELAAAHRKCNIRRAHQLRQEKKQQANSNTK